MTEQQKHIITCDELDEIEEELFLTGHDDTIKKIIVAVRSRQLPAPDTIDASKWSHEETMNRLQCAYDRGEKEGQARILEDLQTWRANVENKHFTKEQSEYTILDAWRDERRYLESLRGEP